MKKENDQRPEAYPKPTETDQQLKNQNEFTERQSSRKSEDMPVDNAMQEDEGKMEKTE